MSAESAACSIDAKVVRTKSQGAWLRALCDFIDVFLEVAMLLVKPWDPLSTMSPFVMEADRAHQGSPKLPIACDSNDRYWRSNGGIVASCDNERVCAVRHNFRRFR
jgi:hypothetical protein